MNRNKYTLDEQPVAICKLCKAQGWPKDIVLPIMQAADAPTTLAELRARVVAHRARSTLSHRPNAAQRNFASHRLPSYFANKVSIKA